MKNTTADSEGTYKCKTSYDNDRTTDDLEKEIKLKVRRDIFGAGMGIFDMTVVQRQKSEKFTRKIVSRQLTLWHFTTRHAFKLS